MSDKSNRLNRLKSMAKNYSPVHNVQCERNYNALSSENAFEKFEKTLVSHEHKSSIDKQYIFSNILFAEFIYNLSKIESYIVEETLFIKPILGFSHDSSLPDTVIQNLFAKADIRLSADSVVCIMANSDNELVFTDEALYFYSSKQKQSPIKIAYSEILYLVYFRVDFELIIGTHDRKIIIDDPIWNKNHIHDILQFASGNNKFCSSNKAMVNKITLQATDNYEIGAIISGMIYGNISNASSLYDDYKIVSNPRGHGFAAENANHLYDFYHGKKVKILGSDNAKDGADRLVDGVQIQTKYCASGSKCINSCFDEQGKFRYLNSDGSPMQIEVPSDKYDDALKSMRHKIEQGQVKGVTNPDEADNIVRKGNFTYAQARNIAKAGTVESITYDAASGAIVSASTFGITATISLATAIWQGEKIDVAIKSSVVQGLKVGGSTFATAILAGQLSKAGLNSLLVGSSEAIIALIGPKASAILVNAFRSGTNIYGAAAMKSAAKLLRTNAITGAVSFVVLSTGDIINIFSGKISAKQLFKNLTITASSIGSGTVGWIGGATAGAAAGTAVPIIGNAIGGVVGGVTGALLGGVGASKGVELALGTFIEDDAEELMRIIENEFKILADEYLLSKFEAEIIVDKLQEKLNGEVLLEMFASEEKIEFVHLLLVKYFKEIAKSRRHIYLPSQEQAQHALQEVLEEIANIQEVEGLIFA